MLLDNGLDCLHTELIWRTIAWLPSVEACKVLTVSSSVRTQLKRKVGDRPYLTRFIEEESVCGTISRDGIWLHCIVGWDLIAHLKKQLRCFWLLDELRFRSREEVYGLISAMEAEAEYLIERERSALLVPMVFIGEWEFPSLATGDWAKSDRPLHLRSTPKLFSGGFFGTFKVALVVSSNGKGGMRLEWEIEHGAIFDMLNVFDMDINLEISGVFCSCGAGTVPEIASCSTQRVEQSRSTQNEFAASSCLGNRLLSGLPLLCCMRCSLSVSKCACAVQPESWIQSCDRDLVLESVLREPNGV
jgi:hypothetical protein